MVYSGSNSNT
jgi:hypothetical protein